VLPRCTRLMDITDSGLDPLRDIQLALRTATSLQTSIRHADVKAQTLLGVDGSIVAVAADHASVLLRISAPMSFVALILAAITMGGLALNVGQLLMVIAPRLSRPLGHNRFSFPNVARLGHRSAPADVRRYRNESWDLVATLAGIAAAKHAGVRHSIASLALTRAAASGLHILTNAG
jgi:hypothetical protein